MLASLPTACGLLVMCPQHANEEQPPNAAVGVFLEGDGLPPCCDLCLAPRFLRPANSWECLLLCKSWILRLLLNFLVSDYQETGV